jgi:hypothetical protein
LNSYYRSRQLNFSWAGKLYYSNVRMNTFLSFVPQFESESGTLDNLVGHESLKILFWGGTPREDSPLVIEPTWQGNFNS